jgi:WD40 repeat protein
MRNVKAPEMDGTANPATSAVSNQNVQTRRQDALSAMARAVGAVAPEASSSPQESNFGSLSPRADRKRAGVIMLSALIVLTLLVVGVFGYQRYSASKIAPIPHQLRVDLTTSKLYCPQFIAWSPDSLSLAVIADAQDCNTETAGPATQLDQALAVYSARTGALEKQVGITSTLAAANLTGSSITTIGWSHDGSSVYVICAVQSASGQTGAAALLVVPVGSSHTQVYTSSLVDFPATGVIWNLRGRVSASAFSQPQTPALTYVWSSGEVVPGQSFSTDLTSYTRAVNQAGERGGFSFWQPGTITPLVASSVNSVAPEPPFALIFASQTNQFSPDGSSFASGLSLYGRLQAPTGTGSAYQRTLCTTLETKNACLSPVIPYADKALATVAIAVEQGVQIGGGNTFWYPASVAWRPDGAFLAALLPADGFDANGSTARITIYNTSTGAVAARFAAARTFTSGSLEDLGVSPVLWSPSGQQIALADFASSTITIWDVRSLKA